MDTSVAHRRFALVAGLLLVAVGHIPAEPLDNQGDPLPPGAIARLGSVRFRSHGNVDHVLVSADGKRILSTGRMYELWDGDTGRLLPRCREIESNEGGAWSVFSPVDNNILVVRTSVKRQIRVIDWESGKLFFEAPAPDQHALGAAVSPDGKTLYSSRSYQYPDKITSRLWK